MNPQNLYVSGQPLLFRGWNGRYTLCDGDTPKWRLHSHNYYGMGIRDAVIEKEGGRWLLKTTDWPMVITSGGKNDLPIGDWGDILVTTDTNMSTWWRSNSSITMVIIFGTVFICSLSYACYTLFL